MNVLYINIPTNAAMDERKNEGTDGWMMIGCMSTWAGLVGWMYLDTWMFK